MAPDRPSLVAFQKRFPDVACAAYLAALRWPYGFLCPTCGYDQAWMLDTKWTHQCRDSCQRAVVQSGARSNFARLRR